MYKEFGFWKEYGNQYKDYPSVSLYRNKEINKLYDKEKLIQYLHSGGTVAASSKIVFPHLFKSHIGQSGEFLLLTDGFWIWPKDLCEYVLDYDVILPNDWYNLILKNNYKISEEIKNQHFDVDWTNR